MRYLAILLLGAVPYLFQIAPLHAQNAAPEGITEILIPADQQRALRSLIPSGKKFVVINAFIAGKNIKDENLGISCSSSTSGTVDATVDDNGNVKGKTDSSGSSNCSERHKFYNTLMLEFPIPDDPNKAIYFVTTQCVEKWIWDHCDMPAEYTLYPVVLEASKHGTFDIYAATEQRLGGKPKAARFAVLSVERIRMKASATPQSTSP